MASKLSAAQGKWLVELSLEPLGRRSPNKTVWKTWKILADMGYVEYAQGWNYVFVSITSAGREYLNPTSHPAPDVAAQAEPVADEYVYGCSHRPAMYGTVPDGFISIDNDTSVYDYGTVIYDRPLTREQVKDYDLHPASANTRRFQVGEFVDWCGDKCEVIAHLPYNGYITIGFGVVTCDELEWDVDMAAWIEVPCIAEPPVNPVWTHSTAPTGGLIITRYFNQRMGYVPVAMRQNRAISPRSAFSSKPMAKVTQPNMQRRSKPLERKQRPVKPVISIAEVLRQMGIG